MKPVVQKLIADSGLVSRRQAEALIKGGAVRVNGKIAKLGDRADASDDVRVRGKRLALPKGHVYIKLNKPSGYVSTNATFPGEKNVFELVKTSQRLSIIGRLDKDSEGLLLLTDDGELVNKLTHPKYGVEKVYVVSLAHDLAATARDAKAKAEALTKAFLEGVDIGQSDGIVRAERFKHLRGRSFEIVLREGKKRQIRRMFRRLSCHVAKLTRVRIGNVTIGRLRKGQWLRLTKEEIEKLKSRK